jgi:hypothetical protein
MKKSLVALLCSGMFPMGAMALDIGTVSDITVTTDSVSLTADQDGNTFTVGYGGLAFTTDDSTKLGVSYDTSLVLGLSGGVSYDYEKSNDHVLGVNTSFESWGANVETDVSWNINNGEWSAEVGTGYSLMGVDGQLTTNWDIDDFSYEGFDVDAGYTWVLADNFSVRPNVTVPFDSDWTRGDLTAGISIQIDFGKSASE